MQFNYLGIIAAVSAFLGIWFGHVAVRRFEFISPTIWLPCVLFSAAGIALEYFSTQLASRPLAIVPGILGITLLWDAVEILRQQSRVCKGHAPANPNNPRHVNILATHPSATTADLLKQNSQQGVL
jgi:hypothetical protein